MTSSREYRLKKKYGMTLEEYNHKLEGQGGVCAICHKSPTNKNLCVDHNHKTQNQRGLLCTKCNYRLGLIKDDLEFLKNAAKYLEVYEGKENEPTK